MSKPVVKTTFFFVSVLMCTFLLAYAWEHGWEGTISRLLDLPYDEDFEDAERWRFIVTSIGFSAVSLLVPTALMHILLVKLGRSNAALSHSRETAISMAFTDALTGLPNRRSLIEDLEAMSLVQPRAGHVHALMMLDLDKFKSINDVFGHTTGDVLLNQVGTRMGDIARTRGLVCRLGGDEFACVIRDVDIYAVEAIAREVESALTAPFLISGREHSVGVSIGIAYMPSHGRSSVELLRRADIALYRAKGDDQSRIQLFDLEHERMEQRKQDTGRALKQAIIAGAVVPYFQPIVDLNTGDTVGFEALARWVDGPQIISPAFFIPLAEELSLINDITLTILEQACCAATTWPAQLGVSVNMSPLLLRKNGLALKIQSILLASGLNPTRLTIEITENMRLEDMPLAVETFRILRQIGVKFALDDFGTGFASIHHLKELRFDSLKLDMSYISALGKDAENDAIVRSTLTLAKALQMKVVCEGIEDIEQSNWLTSEGGGFGQGYLFGRPMPGRDIQAHLNGNNLKMSV